MVPQVFHVTQRILLSIKMSEQFKLELIIFKKKKKKIPFRQFEITHT